MSPQHTTLFNRDFLLVCVANFLFYFAFYLLLPILPPYLLDEMHAGKTVMGVVLALYTIGALTIRPFSGMLVDRFQRKPLYLLCYFGFAACFVCYCFVGYMVACQLLLLGVVRCMHGAVFGIATTSANTLAVDTMPPTKIGRGIGIYGTTSSLAMALGPTAALLLLEATSYETVFVIGFITALAAFVIGLMIRSEKREISIQKRRGFALNQIFLTKGWASVVSLLLTAFLYGVLLNYLALFAKEHALKINAGYFFCCFAVGIIVSRFIAGRMIDNDHLCSIIVIGKITIITATLLLVYWHTKTVFFSMAFFLGFGFGMISPTYQTVFIRLARIEQRGMANSTYLTSWDAGIGVAVLFGGMILEHTTVSNMFLIAAVLVTLSILFFVIVSEPQFKRRRIS